MKTLLLVRRTCSQNFRFFWNWVPKNILDQPKCVGFRKSKKVRNHSTLVCIPQQSQTAHRGVKIVIFVSLWLLSKGQSGEILLGVNTSTVSLELKKNILIIIYVLMCRSWSWQQTKLSSWGKVFNGVPHITFT